MTIAVELFAVVCVLYAFGAILTTLESLWQIAKWRSEHVGKQRSHSRGASDGPSP